MEMPPAVRCRPFAWWLLGLADVEIRVAITALDCVDHIVDFRSWCLVLLVR